MNVKKILTNWKVILLITFLLFALFSIQPKPGNEGVTIRSVVPNSSAALSGIENPNPKLTPLAKERIIEINGEHIVNEDDFYRIVSTLKPNRTVRVETERSAYTILTREDEQNLGLSVYTSPTSNLRKGLDLAGGTRVLLEPAEPITDDSLEITVDNLKERLNVYGLSDVVVQSASDLTGASFILIEIAGVTEGEVRDLLARQGKFEAKIANETVFFGGKKDITYVCRSADCSGIDPQRGCSAYGDGYGCNFFFAITLSPEAAERQAAVTRTLPVESLEGSPYLSEPLDLYLDDSLVDSLRIGAELKGRATTNIQISGSSVGRTYEEATTNTLQAMKKLQTILITGSLPVKLNIVKIDTISPSLGEEFLNNILLVGALAILSVIVVVYLRYRKVKIVIPMVLTLVAELLLILGFASLVGWNMDLAAIAGIIIVAGTGVDHLIVITDETLRGETVTDWKRRIKNAMFIVMGAYFTTVAGMLPLLWAGAGLLKGFALTTMAGISFGVLIARPAYAAIVEKLFED